MKEKTSILLALTFIFLVTTAACIDSNHDWSAFAFFIVTIFCLNELIDSLN